MANFSLDFVHHSVHFCKTHNACNNVAANHKRRDAVFEAAANHEIARVRQNRGMKPCDIAHDVTGVMSFAEMDAMMYKIEGEDLYLIGTSEHSMIGKFIDTMNKEDMISVW